MPTTTKPAAVPERKRAPRKTAPESMVAIGDVGGEDDVAGEPAASQPEPNGFDPRPYARSLSGRGGALYLDVKWRIIWLRDEHPDASITTELLDHVPAKFAMFKATVSFGNTVCTGHGSETSDDFGDFIEKAETKAIGRALQHLGYGAAGMPDDVRVVDTPVDPPKAQESASGRNALLDAIRAEMRRTHTGVKDFEKMGIPMLEQTLILLKEKPTWEPKPVADVDPSEYEG